MQRALLLACFFVALLFGTSFSLWSFPHLTNGFGVVYSSSPDPCQPNPSRDIMFQPKPSSVKVLWLCDPWIIRPVPCSQFFWERDFISHLFGSNIEYASVAAIDLHAEEKYVNRSDWEVLVYFSDRQESPDTSRAFKIAQSNLNRKVLVHLADEVSVFREEASLIARGRIFSRLYNLFPLVLRQYGLRTDIYRAKIFHLPLGYGAGVYDGLPIDQKLVPATMRKYHWGFSGTENTQDRPEMLSKMEKLGMRGRQKLPGNKRSMISLYRECTFVPVGRGGYNTECFRATEAASAGAIPIVVVSKQERDFAYGSLARFESEKCANKLPPFIYAENWSLAARKCKELLQDSNKLLLVQKDVMENLAMKGIKEVVNSCLA